MGIEDQLGKAPVQEMRHPIENEIEAIERDAVALAQQEIVDVNAEKKIRATAVALVDTIFVEWAKVIHKEDTGTTSLEVQQLNTEDVTSLIVIERLFGELNLLRKKDPGLVDSVVYPVLDKIRDIEFYNFRKKHEHANAKVKAIEIFSEALAEYRDHDYESGDRVYELKGKNPDVKPCAKGMIVREGNMFLLNGHEPLYEGKCDEWFTHPEGVVVRIGNKFLLNGEKLLYEGDYTKAWGTVKGLMIEKGAQVLLEGVHYADMRPEEKAIPHPFGLVTRSVDPHTKFFERKRISYSSWDRGTGYFTDTGDDYVCNYGLDGNVVHKNINKDGIPQLLSKNHTVIFEGKWDKVKEHPRGVLISAKNKIFLDSTLLYEGKFDDFLPHQNGVLVRVGTEWRIYKDKS